MIFGQSIHELLVRVPVVLFALTIHEMMHAWAAYRCGDDTAARMGRLTLNPLVHLDPIGTLCLMFAPIGWAKPVPVNPANFPYETRRRDQVLVSGAGIAANLGLGIALALVIRGMLALGVRLEEGPGPIIRQMLAMGMFINFALAVFNLLPIPPLDGSHILENVLPPNAAAQFRKLRPYGMALLLGFVFLNMWTGLLAWPIVILCLVFAGSDATGALFESLAPAS
jgi:Zn-dependent protease